jgi:inositol-hexakisphosphate kinase
MTSAAGFKSGESTDEEEMSLGTCLSDIITLSLKSWYPVHLHVARLLLLTTSSPPMSQQYNCFPLSPPSSEPATPCTHTITPFSNPRFTDNTDDSDGYMTQRSSKPPRKSNRALTLPAGSEVPPLPTVASPSKTLRTRYRRSSSASSSTSTSPENYPPQSSSTGRGRKVAATLQLFKESDDSKPGDPSSSKPDATSAHLSPEGDVAEAQFEFVKRSEWPDREAAAVRRERSSTVLEHVRARESTGSARDDNSRVREQRLSGRDSTIHDLAQWRKDAIRQESSRGRRRERAGDDITFEKIVHPEKPASIFHEPPSPYVAPRSRAYPPSPSPSRPPTHRVPQPPDQRSPALTQTTPRSITFRTSPDPAYVSPWTTDDESAWETGSAATSTTSTHPLPLPSSHDSASPSLLGATDDTDFPLLYNPSENGLTNLGTLTRNNSDLDLPHIPLRPFRNQVGGHSAIYKFTKQAVCKVCILFLFSFFSHRLTSLLLASCVTGKSLLRVCRAGGTSTLGIHSAISRCHACQLPTRP